MRQRAAAAGLSLSDHYALNVLVARGDCRLGTINDLIGHLGLATDLPAVRALEARGLVTTRDETSPDILVALTEAGQALMIELIATVKAREADAQLRVGEADTRLLKRLLKRFVRALEEQDEDGVSRPMDVMRAVARGDADATRPAVASVGHVQAG